MIVNLKMKSIALLCIKLMLLLIFVLSCGGDSDLSVHEDIEKYPNGATKVHVRFHSAENVLERHISEPSGQVVSVEFDSLLKKNDFKNFLEGKWTVNRQVFGADTLFSLSNDNDTSIVVDSKPESVEYIFSNDSLFVKGSLYNGFYSIKYLDSLSFQIKGSWQFDTEGTNTYRKINMDKLDTLTILSYSKFIWNNHFSSPKKDNKITFYRSF